jgi:C_GCAxxG_C_C family probable redox protein
VGRSIIESTMNPLARLFPKCISAAPAATPGTADAAAATFRGGTNCTQAVLAAFGAAHGIDRDTAMRLGGAFGSGMQMGETCGAVTGALMVVGLRHAKASAAGFLSRDRTEQATLDFVERFKARNGTVSCKELLGCDLATPEGRAAARRDRSFKKRCPQFVRDAAEILDEMQHEGGGTTR